MFHYSERVSSTGEPPTVSSPDSSTTPATTLSPVPPSDNFPSSKSTKKKSSRDSTSNLVPQEADSGYEASPSSTNDTCCTFSFDDGRQENSQTQRNTDSFTEIEPTELEDCSSSILMDFSEELAQEEDECFMESSHEYEDSSQCPCLTCRVENPGTVVNEDVHHISSGACSRCRDGRPSSLPIPIPSSEDLSCRRIAGSRDPRSQRLHSRSVPQQIFNTEIPVLSTSPSTLLRLPSSLHPVSWPTIRPFLSWWLRPSAVDSVTASNMTSSTSTTTRTDRRSRRRLIDSDASSLSSSESDGSEEVFDEAERLVSEEEVEREGLVPIVSSAPVANGHLLIFPERVRFPASASSNSVRRGRSISVNLPLERDLQQACHVVGQALRRLSDQFSTQMNLRRREALNRRYTIDEVVPVSVFRNHYRRGGGGGGAGSGGAGREPSHPFANLRRNGHQDNERT